jgi:hypothetical protein
VREYIGASHAPYKLPTAPDLLLLNNKNLGSPSRTDGINAL